MGLFFSHHKSPYFYLSKCLITIKRASARLRPDFFELARKAPLKICDIRRRLNLNQQGVSVTPSDLKYALAFIPALMGGANC